MNDTRSKFIARFDASATTHNRRPAIAGSFALASDAIPRSFRAWSGLSTAGVAYLRGTHEPQRLTHAVKARFAAVQACEGPPGIDLKPGELVLFENLSIRENEKRPSWYGFARTHETYIRLSAWDRVGEGGSKFLSGNAEPYRPADAAEMDAAHTPAP